MLSREKQIHAKMKNKEQLIMQKRIIRVRGKPQWRIFDRLTKFSYDDEGKRCV